MTATATVDRRHRGSTRPRTIALRVLRLGLAAVFAAAGAAKLAGDAAMVEMFADIGAGQWLRHLVGALELAAAVGLLLPPVAGWAAVGLVGLMTGATLTNVLVLEVGPALTIALLVGAAVVAWFRRDDLRAPAGSVSRSGRRGRPPAPAGRWLPPR
ncbi:DoxX family protein [Blastococcus goldschmidtiae]|uniref:DoxX family protein n=1 Tax=Blastococcus goldschmidtiae TaxID=3075546 RepID=A0ABU2K307_9ACTN|nr:DoxX family protein [Blastococcus sp. DSM 46792]MDT0274570.1 DoxX family protein [Blastococcus sp. DSM 46792]